MLKVLVGLVSVFGVGGYSSGATNCQTVNHGSFKSSIPTDWTLSLLDAGGNSVTSWSAGQTYTAQIRATSTSFKGWSWAPLKGTPTSFPVGSANMAGSFAAGDSYSHSNTGCAGSITQTSGGTTRTLIKAIWTPPAAGTGTVSLWSMMVISKNGNNYNAVLSVPETGVGSPAATASPTGTQPAKTTPISNVLPSAVPQQVVVQTPAATSSMNVMAAAIGGAMAGAVLLAVIGPVVHHALKGRRRPISSYPTVIMSNPLPRLADQSLA
jgi:hypothetical protein